MTKKIVALGGDGIGPEVVDAAIQVLESMGLDLEITKPLVGEAAIKKFGTPFPKEAIDLTNQSDAILFGATERASVIILTYLRWTLDTYANLRPIKYYEGVSTPIKDPEEIDFLIVRENSEGLYPEERETSLYWRRDCPTIKT